MTQPDRDDEFIKVVVRVLAGLVLAVEHRSPEEVTGNLARLMDAVIAYHATIGERAGDAPLRRAVAALNAGGTHYSPPVAE